jgi:polyisoprenoid-binding protein YceI
MRMLLAILLAAPLSAHAGRFIGDDTSGSIHFEMEASLHRVPGTVTSFTTELNLKDSITGKVVVQGAGIKTGIGVRDKRMYSFCLETDRFPTIEFEVRGAKGDTEGLLSKEGTGSVNLHGQLKIRSTTRDVVIPATYTWSDGQLQLSGTKQIKWTDYGVPDPSILISTLYPDVSVSFDMRLHEGF